MPATKAARDAWTKEAHEFAVKNYGPMSAEEIGKRIGKTADAVRKYIKRYDDMRLCR